MEWTLTRARGLAVVLIAVATLGLGYARFGSGARHVTVHARERMLAPTATPRAGAGERPPG